MIEPSPRFQRQACCAPIPSPKGYTDIPNALLEDKQLTWEAKGLMVYLLSMPEDYQIDPVNLVRNRKIDVKSVQALLRELTNAGYLTSEEHEEESR